MPGQPNGGRTALVSAMALTMSVACASSYTAGSRALPAQTPAAVPAHADPVSGPAVSGQVVDESGRAVGGAVVVVAVALSGMEQFAKGFAALSSAGILCAVGVCSGPSKQGYSAADGTFALAVPGPNADKDNYYLAVATPRGAGQVGTRLTLPATSVAGATVGDVLLVSGAPAVTSKVGRDHLTPPQLPGRVHPGATTVTATGEPVQTNSLDVSGGYDPRVLEDQAFTLRSIQSGTDAGRPALFSSSLPVQGHSVPPSRGAACELAGPTGKPVPQQPCPLTDGTFTRTFFTPDYGPGCPNQSCLRNGANPYPFLDVRLSSAVRANLIVVRGCISECTLSISSDGRTFQQVGSQPFGAADSILVQVLTARPVRAVRLSGPFPQRLIQISVFATG
jgi:hypothetical protein